MISYHTLTQPLLLLLLLLRLLLLLGIPIGTSEKSRIGLSEFLLLLLLRYCCCTIYIRHYKAL